MRRRDVHKLPASTGVFVALRRVLLIAAMFLSGSVMAETPLERGAYLVRGIAACGNCHTTRDSDEKPIAAMELAGGRMLDVPLAIIVMPNITPDKETGIGTWSDEQIALAIREGRRPDGTLIGPAMPIGVYRGMSDTDTRAVVAYIRSVPSISHKLARTVYRMPLPTSYGPSVSNVPDVSRSDHIAYGRYLAGPVGHCLFCHTPMVQGRSDANRTGLGDREFPVPGGGTIHSRNITPDSQTGIGMWSDQEIKTAITTGVRRDGGLLVPFMAFRWYADINEDDLDAIVAYLRSLNPVATH
jgi:mono/diheme cytochrome c family protein